SQSAQGPRAQNLGRARCEIARARSRSRDTATLQGGSAAPRRAAPSQTRCWRETAGPPQAREEPRRVQSREPFELRLKPRVYIKRLNPAVNPYSVRGLPQLRRTRNRPKIEPVTCQRKHRLLEECDAAS